MSKTEQDIEASTPGDHLDVLAAADDDADQDGPSTADLDALDESLVGSIAEYATGGRDQSDRSEAHDDQTLADDDSARSVDVDVDVDDPMDEQMDEAIVEELVEHVDGESGEDEPVETDGLLIVAAEIPETDEDVATVTDVIRTDGADVAPTGSSDGSSDASTGAASTTIEQPVVSSTILDELRRAEIDGPVVGDAPQDDTTSGRRRPKRALDYDPAPVPIPLKVPRILGRKPRVRKVTRVVRHVDPWSVFKIGVIANLVLYVVVLTAGVLLWNVAYATGTVENVERFFESFGWQSFDFNGGQIYHSAWIAGLFAVIGLTGLWVLLATLFNLITDLVGGVRFTVLEEEVVESRTSPMRRFVVRRAEPEIPAVLEDHSGAMIREAVVDDSGPIQR